MRRRESFDFLRAVPPLLFVGRQLLTLLETAMAIALLVWRPDRPTGAYLALAALCLYNLIVLLLLRRVSLERIRVWLLLAGDLFFVTLACNATGDAESPFIGHFYLLTVVAALFYGIRGGLIVGVLASGITLLLGWHTAPRIPWSDILHTVPYFPIIGGFTGFLIREMERWFQQYKAVDAEVATRREADEQAQREMSLARLVQESVALPDLPTHENLTFALRSVPSREVGGDFPLLLSEENRLGLILGDVSGKGVAAALVATSLSQLLPYLSLLTDPLVALARLNQDLNKRLPEGAFVALLCADLDPNEPSVRILSAGHPLPLLWSAKTRKAKRCGASGTPPLGLFTRLPARIHTAPFVGGDTLLLYSDALTETRNAKGEMFGEERLLQVFAANAEKDLEALADALVAAVTTHGPLTDDLTLLFCRKIR